MLEWLVERGIGEDRAILTDGHAIFASRLQWHGEIAAGQTHLAKLAHRTAGQSRGTATLANGQSILVDKLPKALSEGSEFTLLVTRAAISERGRLKLPQGRVTDQTVDPTDLLHQLRETGTPAREVHRFPDRLWDDLLADALSRTITFDGGALLIDTTPAMTVIDIDGTGSGKELALAAIPAITDNIQKLDIGGVIGIDFPTPGTKAERKAIDDALAQALGNWPHERTAMNGFGFVQLVARLERPSLVHRATHSRTGMLARQILRKAESVDGAGAILLTIHPALRAKLKPEWLDQLARRTGREVRIDTDPSLALEGSFAQSVPL